MKKATQESRMQQVVLAVRHAQKELERLDHSYSEISTTSLYKRLVHQGMSACDPRRANEYLDLLIEITTLMRYRRKTPHLEKAAKAAISFKYSNRHIKAWMAEEITEIIDTHNPTGKRLKPNQHHYLHKKAGIKIKHPPFTLEQAKLVYFNARLFGTDGRGRNFTPAMDSEDTLNDTLNDSDFPVTLGKVFAMATM
ncbi:MAG: hypothetical protein HC773_00885 [Scytonema sp. CRU_2_7]|nr:hypothetical protein [Scytonema sp. CRU_2_7]